MPEKIPESKWHQSQRGYFAGALYNAMVNDPDIWLVTGDLGYKQFDEIQRDFPNRFVNAGASEQAACGICVGLAQESRKPFFYSITPFLLYRPFETIRNYLQHEQAPVRLVGSGRDFDYRHDGFSHHAHDALLALNYCFPNIKLFWPDTKEEVPNLVKEMVRLDRPSFISLVR